MCISRRLVRGRVWMSPVPRARSVAPFRGLIVWACTGSAYASLQSRRGHSTTDSCGSQPDSHTWCLWTTTACPQADSGGVTRWWGGVFHGRMNPFSLASLRLLPASVMAAALITAALPPVPGTAAVDSTSSAALSPVAATNSSRSGALSSEALSSETHNWVTPVPAMEILTAFDPPDKPWLKGHRGIDVLTVAGEPLRAPTEGTIRFAGTVAGMPTVSVLTADEHVLSFQPASTQLQKGEEFSTGERIGTVESGSHCDRSCLHIGAWANGGQKHYLDPAVFFGQEQSLLLPLSRRPTEEPKGGGGGSATSGAGAWGGHSNGKIPASAMCELKTAPGQMLRCDAQAAFDRMSSAFEARFGTPISVTDAYRDYATQVVLKRRKGRMAATPGTSNHGWALAVDLGSGINSFGTAQHQWMRANGPKFGWIHPGWARQTGSLPEPWHWEFRK